MPTGYTAAVGDGDLTEFPAFAMQCARAFGALIVMRDHPHDAVIPDEFVPDTYHERAEAEARAEFQRLSGLTLAERQAEYNAAFAKELARREESDRKRQATVDRYNEMLAKVRAWRPPTADHDGLKRFMVEQLEESIKFDGPIEREYLPKFPTGVEAWYAAQIKRAKEDVKYHAEHHAKEVARTAERNKWVRDLRESLVGSVIPSEGGERQ